VVAYAAPLRGRGADRAAVTRGHVEIIHLRRLGVASNVWVYRPDLPDSATLPVVYFLHGLPGQPQSLFKAGLAHVMDNYLAHGGTPVVIAAPDGNSPRHADTEWGDASDGSDELETFILTKVFAAVEQGHPRDAAHRAIAGFSMGGYGSMNIALQHPERFGQIVSIAGYFHLDDPSDMFATAGSRRANDPELHVKRAQGHHILLLDGRDDRLALTRHESQRFKGLLHRAGVPATLKIPPGTHSWDLVIDQLPAVLRFLAGGWGSYPQ